MAIWNPRANQIFASLVELPAPQRHVALDQACAGDKELRGQVEALLAAHAQAGSFLDRPVNPADVETIAPESNGIDPVLGMVRYVGDYELLAELGRGGMGVVYKARQASLQRLVALKMILAGGHAGPAHLARFRTECEAIARLQHPNIVQIHEVGEHEEMPFYSMEYCPGGSLDKKFNGTPWQPVEAAHLVETLARAMHAAHTKNVIHRDLKPANVLFDAEATPKITDFGLAKKLDDVGQTASGAIMGTPSYMAPEQADGKSHQIGPACDIYALGAILYELLTGRPPFKATTAMDTILQVVMDEPVPPSRLQPKTPRDLETICLKCLHKSQEKRYASAAKLATDLRRFQAGEPIEARPAGWVERGWKWVKRRPTAAALTLVSVVALLGLLGVDLWFNARLTEERNEALGQKKTAEEQKDLANERAKAEAMAKQIAQDESNRAEEQKKLAEEKTKLAETEKARAETQLRRAEMLVYAGQLARAQSEIENNNPVVALRLLEECQWDLRGWEHRHLWTRSSSKATLVEHTGSVLSVACSPDGRRILTGSSDQTAKVWDAATGQVLFSLKGHTNWVTSVAYSPDGRRILTGSSDQTAKMWDADKGQEVLTIKGSRGNVSSVAFSPDGRRLLTGSIYKDGKGKGEATVWDATTGQEIFSLKGHTGRGVTSVAFSPDGQRILTGGDDVRATVWDAATGQELFSLHGHTRGVSSVAFSPDSRSLLTGSGDKTARVWDAEKGKLLFSLKGHTGDVTSVAFSPDGRRILTGGGGLRDRSAKPLPGEGKVWDGATGQALFSLKGHTSDVTSVAFSPDGQYLLTGSDDSTAKVWDADKSQEIVALKGHTGDVTSVAFSPDGRRILTGSGGKNAQGRPLPGEATVWDAATGQALFSLKGHTGPVSSVAFSPDGRRILTGSQNRMASVWDAATGQELFSLKGRVGSVASVAFSPNGQRLLTSGDDGTTVWDAATGQKLLTLRRDRRLVEFVLSVACSPDGRHILTGNYLRTATVWDAATGQELFSLGHTDKVSSVAFSLDSRRILTGCEDGTAKVWDANTGQELLSLKGHTGDVTSVAFSPDGRRILTGSQDGTAKVWDAATGLELLSLKGHTQEVTSVAFNLDGRCILTGSQDGTARVWDADKSQELFSLKGHTAKVTSVAFSPDGRHLFAQDVKGKILAWETTTGHLLPDPPTQVPAAALQVTSPDGRLLVRIQNGVPVVERLSDGGRGEHPDRAALKKLARFDPDFHTARLAEAESADDDFAMAFHLGHLLQNQPWAADLLVKQAQVFARQRQPQQAALGLARALLLNPRIAFDDPGFAARGDRAAQGGNWPRAITILRFMVEQPGASPVWRSNLLLAELAAGDTDTARSSAGVIVTALPSQSAAALEALSVAPLSEADAAKWEQHMRQTLVRQRNPQTCYFHGVALYRAGKYDEAAKQLAESVRASGGEGSAQTWLFQALVARKQGQRAEALGFLARYEIWHQKQIFPDWRQRVLNQLLLAEAQRAINSKPAVPAKK